jgi:serine/threonine protein kinase/tetratricopeptide (TPR) repeat protein
MDSERWQQIQELLADALERPEGERAGLLTERCGGDSELRAEVESLLRVSDGAEAFFGDLQERVVARGDTDGTHEPDTRRAPRTAEGVQAALESAIGERYRIEELLDQGGMGLVFRAVDVKHGRRVAIKTLQPEPSFDLTPRFEREIRITAGLQHRNILPLLDSGVAEGILYYIMPYVDGESLKTRLDRLGRLPPLEAVGIAIDVADALSHAHGRGVLHRDVKPSNILLSEEQVQVVDFGIARGVVEMEDDELTSTGLAIGTPKYMAPEQFHDGASPRSDVYAIGAVLYESLTGRAWKSRGEDGHPGSVPIPEDLEPIVEKALAERPSDRWDSAAAFARPLRQWHRLHALSGAVPRGRRVGFLDRIRRRWLRGGTRVGPKSVAVLPFGNLSGDEETEYFSDGITEDIIAHLSRIGALKVISRTSVMRFKDTDVPIPKIGRELRVTNVLEGSVRRKGSRVRVVSQLIDVESDAPVWTETFDRELTDIFDIQSEIAQKIGRALHARISDTERSVLRRRPTDDIEAHDLYLKGRYLWNRRTRSALESAEEQFQRAVSRDPLFAPAYAGLADVYLLLAGYAYRDEIEALHRARVASDRALQLDDALAEAHASRGQILRADRDWQGEEREYRRAIELNPSYATAHQWYATLLTALARHDEASKEIASAVDLDPLSHAISVTSGIVRFLARDYEGALEEFNRTLELAPRFFSVHAWLLLLWSELGEHDRAFQAWESMRQFHPDPRLAHSSKAYIHARAGDGETALEIVRRQDAGTSDRGWEGVIHAQLGDADEAFRLLEEALDDPSWRLFVLQRNLLFYLKVGPWFDPIRDHPRFEGLLRRLEMA